MEYQVIHYVLEGGFLVGMLGMLWKIGESSNQKISTLFRRFDEHKEHMENYVKNNYVHKDVIKVQMEHSNKDMERLEKKVDDGFTVIGKKLDRIIENDGKSKSNR